MRFILPTASLLVVFLTSCGSDTVGPRVTPREDGGTPAASDAGGSSDVRGPAPDVSCVGSLTQGCGPSPTEDAGGPEPDAAADAGGADVGDADGLGFYAGRYFFDDYALLTERDFPGEDAATLFGADCTPLARIPQEYADVVCESLQARLDDGATFDRASGPCSCGSSCMSAVGQETCWERLDQATYPWGYLLPERPLEPLRSLGSLNPDFPLGEVVYIPKWDGINVPSIAGAGGFVHDGCFVVDFLAGDLSNSMGLFYGPYRMKEHFLSFFGEDIDGDVYRFSPKCAGDVGGAGGSALGEDAGVHLFSSGWVTAEADYDGGDDATLYGADCAPLADVPSAFADDLCREEPEGRLEEGVAIQSAGSCSCGRPCPGVGMGRLCWRPLDADAFPWVRRIGDRRIVPLRSVGSNNNALRLGEDLYLPSWDGVVVPPIGGVEGFVHDGCFRLDHWTGYVKGGREIEVFYGSEGMSEHFQGDFGEGSMGAVYRNSPNCAGR